jgi:ABC-2 type transport system ATP-binding protein
MSDLAIDVHGLNKSFGDKHVVHDLSLQVEHGQILGFLGRTAAARRRRSACCAGCCGPTQAAARASATT